MNADKPYGHFPVAFAELSSELIALGCHVEALTRHGWLFQGDSEFTPLTVRRFGSLAEIAIRWATRLRFVPPQVLGRRLEEIGRTIVIVCIVNRVLRRSRCSDVIVYTNVDPMVCALLARRGRWLSYQFFIRGRLRTMEPAGGSRGVLLSILDKSIRTLLEVAARRGRRSVASLRVCRRTGTRGTSSRRCSNR